MQRTGGAPRRGAMESTFKLVRFGWEAWESWEAWEAWEAWQTWESWEAWD